MNKWTSLVLGLVILIVVSILIFSPSSQPPNVEPVSTIDIQQDLSAFSRITQPVPLSFPRDMGAHPDYLSEWWYYTGNLFTDEGRQFAYQLTFFRRAISDPADGMRESEWAADQIYFAHFALVNVEESEHQAWEVYSRGAAGLAGAVTDPVFQVWLNDWQVLQIGENKYQLFAERDGIVLDLRLQDEKGIILHGDQGLSQKGAQPGNASMYFSQTRLVTDGEITIGDMHYLVTGESWMDHEFGTSALGPKQVGWDWFSIQMDNQSELMLFQIRNKEGGVSAESGGSWIGSEGDVTSIKQQEFSLAPLAYWENPQGVSYPIKWEIRIPSQNAVLTVLAVMPDQENRFSFFQYWEGAVQVEGVVNGKPVIGYGFLEMTGYAHSMDGVF